MLKKLLPLLFCLSAGAQTLYLYPKSTTISAAKGSYVTITAMVNGANNKGVSWTTTGGTLSSSTCTDNAPCTVSLYSAATGGPYTVTATSLANGSVTASTQVTFTASPAVTTGHPRLLITSSMVSALQAKAVSGNPMYQAIRTEAIAAYTTDNAIWSWTCSSGTGLPSSPQYNSYKDKDAFLFAYMSLIDPTDPTYNWGCYGHDVGLYVLANIVNGNTSFAGNYWSDEAIYITVFPDWLMGSGAISNPTDITAVRTFAAFAMRTIANYGNGYTAPYNNWNNYQQFVTGSQWDLVDQRAMGNNYTLSRILYMTAFSLMFDDNTTDDPPLTGSSNTCGASRYVLCPDYTGGSLHAYWSFTAGAMLLKEWAHLEDPKVVQNAYNTAFPSGGFSSPINCAFLNGGASYPCFGDARDGESSEGSWYQYSMYRLRWAMNMMHTTGNDDPLLWGPQVSLENSSFWDMKLATDLEFLTGFGSNGNAGSPAYNYFSTGDADNYVRVPSDFITEASILTADSYSGRTDRNNADLWIVMNAAYGGPLGTSGGCTSHCGFISELSNDIAFQTAPDLFISLPASDPTVTLPTDPRPNYPTDWYNPSNNQHQMVRSGWTGSAAILSVYGANTLTDHEHEYQGGFDLYINGEYATKRRSEFNDYNNVMSVGQFQNAGAYIDALGTQAANCNSADAGTLGGQFWDSYQAGFTTANHSEMPSYAAYGVNTVPAYQGCWFSGAWNYADTTTASRDILFLRGTNQLIYYDRVGSIHTSSKAVYLNTTGAPTITAKVAHWLTRSGTQKVNFTALLPSSGTLGASKLVINTVTGAPHSSLQNGTTMQMTCTANYADGTNADVTSTATWTSLYTPVATVNSTGLVTAVGLGGGGIQCASQGIQSYGNLTVISGSSSGTWTNVSDTDQETDWEPYTQLKLDAGSTTGTQFLSTLEVGTFTYTPTTTSLVQSSSGQNFDGALIGSSLAMFMRTVAAFTGTTYPASGATVQYLSDLTPNTTYSISGTGTPSTATSDDAGVLTFAATGIGNITVGTASIAATTTLQGVVCIGCTLQ